MRRTHAERPASVLRNFLFGFSPNPRPMDFLPFHNISQEAPCVVVDSMHPDAAATLSHWRGAPVPDQFRADTSTEIVIKALRAQDACMNLPFVSNNHFDIDGGLGVWAMINPELALIHAETLIQAALIGDFREYDPAHPSADRALKLVCWINEEEKSRFYEPFGEKNEAEASVPKYHYFLPLISAFLEDPDRFATSWQAEFDRVQADIQSLNERGSRILYPELRVLVVRHPEPLHYYALFQQSRAADLVLMQFSDQRYELEYKYTGWVDTADRRQFPRLPFDALADRLQQLEKEALTWWGNSVMDTGPSMRLGGEQLTKAERFAHPYEREIRSSSIDPDRMLEEVLAFYRRAYQKIGPASRWSWADMRKAAVSAGLI